MKQKSDTDRVDDGITVLRSIYDHLKPDIPWSLVESCYASERCHQYESDREMVLSEIKTLVTQFVSTKLESQD